MEHTKGIWHVMDTPATREIFNGCAVIVSDQIDDAVIATIGEDVTNCEGNGRLMAAAPELLDEAKSTDQGYDWLLTQLTDFRLYQGSWSLENGDNWAASLVAHIKIRQIGTKFVISKAEGRE